ncbi:hypothetical protein PoB_001699100 [Plakobranchus ocellatus]|uniref:Uncharacterized protein n=1 Tax=Plakobranchus ocellatus TaxID=259542 RepID=A0AAV3YTQ5_9GAST|nr:hypothetical protein PoB_001699100 [Plakobranchus ocellatus]
MQETRSHFSQLHVFGHPWKKAGAEVMVRALGVKTTEIPTSASSFEVTENLQSKVKDALYRMGRWKSVPLVTNRATLRDPGKSHYLWWSALR